MASLDASFHELVRVRDDGSPLATLSVYENPAASSTAKRARADLDPDGGEGPWASARAELAVKEAARRRVFVVLGEDADAADLFIRDARDDRS